MSSYTPRTKQLDADNRRRTKGIGPFCVKCNRRVNPNHRVVHIIAGGAQILHPADESLYVPDSGDMCWLPIGNDCAAALGLEWTRVTE